jgi:hypothetical protein
MNWTSLNKLLTFGFALFLSVGTAKGQPDASSKAQGTPGGSSTQDPSPSPAESASQRAVEANKYVFFFFFRAEDEATQATRKTLDAAMPKLADRAMAVVVNIADPREKALVKKYELNRAPMPLLLAVAPNGAVTKGFPLKFTETQLETAFVGPGMQKCLKALQDRKMAFICVQNSTTHHNAEAMKGVKEFAADAQYAKTTEIITVDPAEAAEEGLLKQFKLDPQTTEAVTVFLAPPGTKIGTYSGETSKDVLIAAAKSAAKGCDPKSGCCPAPKKS